MNAFPNQSEYGMTLKHYDLPVYKASEFDFYRVIPWSDDLCNITVSSLHAGNLRAGNAKNRYSLLFGSGRVSYWACSVDTAVRESMKHNPYARKFLLFHAYDDASSTFPVVRPRVPLTVLDGRDTMFSDLLERHESGLMLSDDEYDFMNAAVNEGLDALAYCSKADGGTVNYMFTEAGFRKLMLHSVQICYIRNTVTSFRAYESSLILLVSNSDYAPILDNYGMYYSSSAPRIIIRKDDAYVLTDEYKSMKTNMAKSLKNYGRPVSEWE